ncbi:MAG: glycoside hydrolase family protein, partial [Burkholderiales bacterium]|nr:glycoside hydrolase family protein [Burkholderiales bacterium]
VLESGVTNGIHKGKQIVDGFITEVYDDGYGIPTVGLGHKVAPQDKLKIGDTISIDRCRKFLDIDLHPIETEINRDVKVPLHQHEYDALVSILFNTGPYRNIHDDWYPETRCKYLTSHLNKGQYIKMKNIQTFIARRIPWRRRLEARLFETGNYDAHH